jgi:hypothetical protein
MLNDGPGDGRAAGSNTAAQAGAQPGTASDLPGSQARTDEQSLGARAGSIYGHRHDRLHDSAPCPPARVVTVTAHCPGATGNGKVLEAWGAVQRILGGPQSLASDIEPLGPRQHPPPATTSTSASMACTRAVRALCATMVMTSRRTRPRQLSITCASTGLPDTTFPLTPSTICRLTPPRTMRGSSQRARIADHDHRSRRWPTC